MTSKLYDNDRAGIVSWIVYINGIEVPAQSVSWSYGVWEIPQATINLAPDPILHRLGAEDRIPVQIFYLDQWQHNPPKFCLAFDGEVVAWGQQSTTGARSLSLMCHDYVQILSQLFFFLMSSFDDIAVGSSAEGIGVQGTTVQTARFGALYPFSLFSQGLADVGDGTGNNQVIRRPIDFAYNIVRALIKAQHPNRAVPATNFFAPWCKRTNFHKRWVALPYFDADPERPDVAGIFPVLRAVQDEQAVSAVARMATHTGTSGSMWAMLTEVLRTLLMEISMLPTPAAVRSDFTTLLPKGQPDSGTAPVFLTNYFVKPQTYFALPPACNVVFPSQIETYSYQEGIAEQPTRMYFNEGAVLSALNANGAAVPAGVASLMQDALCTGYPEEVDIAARDAQSSPGQNGRNLLVYPEEFFKGPVILRQSMPRWFSFLLDAMQSPTSSGSGSGGATQDDPSPDSANINRPDPGPEGRFSATNDATSRLSGADDAVFDPANHSQFLRTFGFQAGDLPHGRLPSAQVLQRLRTYRISEVGACMPPQRLPIEPASACPAPRTTGAGSFFSSRGGSPRTGVPATHLHAGLDFSAPVGTTVVSTTPGRVTAKRRVGTNAGGNRVEITDSLGGRHYYMHLDRFAQQGSREIDVGDRVDVGTVIGYVGRTGVTPTSYGAHLHYEVHDSTGKFALNYTSRLIGLKRGRVDAPADTGTAQAQGVAAPPVAPAPGTLQVQAGRIVDAQASEVSAVDTSRNVFKLYAASEYYTQRYSARRGTVTMPFNPYPVPGFSCAVFDRRSTALDVFGYLTSVSHTMTQGSWSTQISFTHGRTMQEMFALMQRTVALESARLGQNQNQIEIAVRNRDRPDGRTETGTTNPLTDTGTVPVDSTGTPVVSTEGQNPNDILAAFAVPVGAIAMAPAEPIEEIRALQEFDRADDFYRTLFWHGTGAGSDILAAEQYAQSRTTSNDVPVPYATVAEIDAAGTDRQRTDLAVVAAQTSEQVARQRPQVTPAVTPDRLRTSAVFDYRDIIEMRTYEGTQIPISVQGVGTAARTRLLQALAAVRAQRQTQRDLDVLRNATGVDVAALLPAADQQVSSSDTQQIREQLQAFLQETEISLRTESAAINVRGDVYIVPRAGAEGLFESYWTAMQYNSRPVCTLEQYVAFLGPDASPEGEVTEITSNLYANVKVHPAPYYRRIRRYRPGPPQVRPGVNITNTETVSDAAAGVGAVAPVREYPTDAIELRVNSVIDYLEQTGLASPAELSEIVSSGIASRVQLGDATGEAELAAIRLAATAGQLSSRAAEILTDVVLRVRDARRNDREVRSYEDAQRRAAQDQAARTQGQTTAGSAPAGAPSTADSAPAAGTGTYPVAGIPADFPDTRANWDILLEQYVYNTLERKPPRL